MQYNEYIIIVIISNENKFHNHSRAVLGTMLKFFLNNWMKQNIFRHCILYSIMRNIIFERL